MSWVVGDAVAVFDKCVDRSWRPGLAIFEEFTQDGELLIGEFWGPVVPETRLQSSDTGVVSGVCPAAAVGL